MLTKAYKLFCFCFMLFLLNIVSTVHSSPTLEDDVLIASADMDGDYYHYWMHLMIRLTNPGENTYDLEDVILRYKFTEGRSCDLEDAQIYWFNVHSPVSGLAL